MFAGGDNNLNKLISRSVNTLCAAVPAADPVPPNYEKMRRRVEEEENKAAFEKCSNEVTALMKSSADKLRGLVGDNVIARTTFSRGVHILLGQVFIRAIQMTGFNKQDSNWHLKTVKELDIIRTTADGIVFHAAENDELVTVPQYMERLVEQSVALTFSNLGQDPLKLQWSDEEGFVYTWETISNGTSVYTVRNELGVLHTLILYDAEGKLITEFQKSRANLP